jgi:diacylglycerol kinase family enzyme
MSLGWALVRLPFVIIVKHTKMRVVHMSHATHVRVRSKRPVAGQIDGEVLLERFYDVTMHPGALEVIVPSAGEPT